MWIALIARIGLALLAALPVERLAAWGVNRLLARVDDGSYDRATKTAEHLIELAELFASILKDKRITPQEASEARARVLEARERLLAAWADGRPSKGLQMEVKRLVG
jgi:hypothetical protein